MMVLWIKTLYIKQSNVNIGFLRESLARELKDTSYIVAGKSSEQHTKY